MQYDVNTPEAYIAVLDHDWRSEKLLEVRTLIMRSDPALKEGIEYKMLCYGNGVKNIFHLNAQKGYVSLYVGNVHNVQNADTLLKPFNVGKGCIRIQKSHHLPDTGLEAFIKAVLDTWKKGGNTDC